MAQYDRRATENGHWNHDTPPVAVWSCCSGTGDGEAAMIWSFAVSFRNGSDRSGFVNMSASMSALGTCLSMMLPLRA